MRLVLWVGFLEIFLDADLEVGVVLLTVSGEDELVLRLFGSLFAGGGRRRESGFESDFDKVGFGLAGSGVLVSEEDGLCAGLDVE